jgi:hypothetical protein
MFVVLRLYKPLNGSRLAAWQTGNRPPYRPQPKYVWMGEVLYRWARRFRPVVALNWNIERRMFDKHGYTKDLQMPEGIGRFVPHENGFDITTSGLEDKNLIEHPEAVTVRRAAIRCRPKIEKLLKKRDSMTCEQLLANIMVAESTALLMEKKYEH